MMEAASLEQMNLNDIRNLVQSANIRNGELALLLQLANVMGEVLRATMKFGKLGQIHGGLVIAVN